jgi:hypothetical protein
VTQPPPEPSAFPPDRETPSRPVPVLPLEYGLEATSRAGSWAAFFARMVAGFIGFILVSVGWIRFGVAMRIHPGMILAGWVVMTATLLWLAVFVRKRYGRAGYGYGILLVFVAIGGVVLLIIGMCWR